MNGNIQQSIMNQSIDTVKLQKMALLYNALENGWEIKKKKNFYVFSKNHENKKEVFLDKYLKSFMVKNLNIDSIFS